MYQDIQGFSALEARLRLTLERLSNGESLSIKDEWIDIASEEFKGTLAKQLQPQEREFTLRASNIGRPLCQLQMDKANGEKSRTDYNHIGRMMLGDATEAIVTLLIKASGANITGQKRKVEFDVNGTIIKGENDIEIDGKVYDVKSASPYAFNHKWSAGWEGVFNTDTFGYVEQLYVYAEGDPNRMGGWIVFDKSSGEIRVVEAAPTEEQVQIIADRISSTEWAIKNDAPFQRCFEPEVETYYKKPTGNLVLPMVCALCSHIGNCWPDATFTTPTTTRANNPKPKWYATIGDN